MTSSSTRLWVLILTSVASLMVALDVLAVTTTLTTIRLELHASIEALEWTITAYNLTFAVFMMPASALGDRFGRRRMFMIGLGIFTLASAGCALAPNAAALIILRTVQGVGAATVTPLAFALVSAAYPPERRGRALGIGGGVTGLATLLGPVIGGGFTQVLSWQAIFWVNVPIGLIAVVLAGLKFEESRGGDARLDVRGLALVTGSALGIVWALIRADSLGWGSAEVVACLAAGLLLGVAFVALERRTAEPLLPMRLFRERGFAAGNAATFCHAVVVLGPVFLMAQYLQTALGYGPLSAGLRLLPWTVTLLIVAPITGSLADKHGPRPVITGGLLLSAIGMGWIGFIASPHLSYAALVAPLVIGGIGNSAVFPAVQSAAVGAVHTDEVGKASGANQMVRELGGVFGIALLAAVFAAIGGYASPRQFSDGFGPALIVCAAVGVLGAVIGLAVPRPRGILSPTRLFAPSRGETHE